jgi:hypothetical protein
MNAEKINLQTLAARVARLESANRRWKSIALLFAISLLFLSTRHAERVAAATKPDRIEPDVLHVRSVEAQDFVLKDENGHVYARLSLNPVFKQVIGRNYMMPSQPVSGHAALQFYDDKGDIVWTAPSKAQFIPVR